MIGGAMTPVPADDPRTIAWEAYKETDEYANSVKWALCRTHVHERTEKYVEVSLWAAFIEGFAAAGHAKVELFEGDDGLWAARVNGLPLWWSTAKGTAEATVTQLRRALGLPGQGDEN